MPSSSSDLLNRERLHLRLEPRLLGQVKGISKRRGVTVTSLIEEGMRLVVRQDEVERAETASRVIDAEQV